MIVSSRPMSGSHWLYALNIPAQVGVKNALARTYWTSVLPSFYKLHTALFGLEAKFSSNPTPAVICRRILQRHPKKSRSKKA